MCYNTVTGHLWSLQKLALGLCMSR